MNKKEIRKEFYKECQGNLLYQSVSSITDWWLAKLEEKMKKAFLVGYGKGVEVQIEHMLLRDENKKDVEKTLSDLINRE